MQANRLRALALAAALIGWKALVAPRLPTRILVPLHAVLGGVLVVSTDAPLGLRSPAGWRGLRWGSATLGIVATAVATATALPPVRRALRARELPESVAGWLLVGIPIGTVLSEELAYRGALRSLATQAFGPTPGRLVTATAFGLSHVSDARGADDSIVGTVLLTGVAGWAFGWLFDRSGSLVAPMLAHLATNEAGAVAALVVRR